MLACRPMLCFAAAVMLGVTAARFHPGLERVVLPGWLAVAALLLWFARLPAREWTPPVLPEGYAVHIAARPGPIARRGLNRFILILCFAFVLLGVMRQSQWRRALQDPPLPDKRYFAATLVADEPAGLIAPGDRWRLAARLLSVDGVPLERPLPLRLLADAGPPVRRGDRVETRLRLFDRVPKAHPEAFDFDFYLERDGLAASAAVVSRRIPVAPVDAVPWYTALRRLVDAARFRAIEVLLRRGGDQGGMLAAMLFGYRAGMDRTLQDAFRRVGIGHVLAISGLHVGLVVWLLWWCCGWLAWPRRVRAGACLGLAVLYLGLAGGAVAATRATVMAGTHLIGVICGLRGDMLNSLGAAAFLIVLVNPTAPLDVSFQLSFAAVVFIHIALIPAPDARPARSRPAAGRRARILRRLRREAVSLTRLSVATSLGLYPIIAAAFHQVNVIGLVLNIVVIPLMGAVLAGGLLLPALGWLPGMAAVLTLPARVLAWIAREADKPWWSSFSAHAPSGWWVAVFFGFVGMYLIRGMVPPERRRLVRRAALAGVGAGLIGVTASMMSLPPPPAARLALLPGGGFGLVVAESTSGGIAVAGTVRRGGLNAAGWLHELRRGGGAGVLALGRTAPADVQPLAYHYPVRAFTSIAITRKEDSGATEGWRPLDGADGVEYALRRDDRGRAEVLALRSGGASLCVVQRVRPETLADAVAPFFPNRPPDLVAATFAGGRAEDAPPHFRVAVRGKVDGPLPDGWFWRNDYGVVVTGEGTVTGFDGSAWRTIASVSAATAAATRPE